MAKLKVWLSGLLAVQMVLVVTIYLVNKKPVSFSQNEALIVLDKQSLKKITLDDGAASVSLVASGDAWLLSGTQLPADESKVSSQLDKLISVEKGWPVTTTDRSHERFELLDDKYVKKIQLDLNDGSSKAVLLGSSPGFRKVHVRKVNADEVFSVALASHDYSVKAEDWLDTRLLSVKNPQKITGRDFEIQKNDNTWGFVQSSVIDKIIPEIDASKVSELSLWLESLTVLRLADVSKEGDVVELFVTEPDNTWTYRFFTHDEKAYVQRTDRKTRFEISMPDYEMISQLNLVYFTKAKTEKNSEVTQNSDEVLN